VSLLISALRFLSLRSKKGKEEGRQESRHVGRQVSIRMHLCHRCSS
jgi:hypothetical protein